jgi:hypothetical protein
MIEDFDDEQNEAQDEAQPEIQEVQPEDSVEISENDIIEIENDLIENDEELSVTNINEDESESDLDIYFKFGTNNHKLEGKHSLKRDTIFNGKIAENSTDENDFYGQVGEVDYSFGNESPIESGTLFEEESRKSEEFVIRRNLARDVYTLLKEKTDIDFKSNRRKPNKLVFNEYYKMLLDDVGKTYTKSEIFVELAYYFTDNIFNMYKLLDKNYAMGIIDELRDKGYLNDITSINFM